MKTARPEPTTFLNVDLDIIGRARTLAPLFRELEGRFIDLYVGPEKRGWVRGTYETRSHARTPEATLRALLKVLEALSPAGRRAWRAAQVRSFDIGIEAGPEPYSVHYLITPETLARVVALRGDLRLTIYAPKPRAARRPRPSPARSTGK